MSDSELIHGLDLVRANSDDLAQPELRSIVEQISTDPRAQRIQLRIARIEAALARAMHCAPVPDGFSARLADKLRAATSGTPELVSDNHHQSAGAIELAPAQSAAGWSRRRWLASSAGVAAAAAAVAIGVTFFRPSEPLDRELLEASRQWHEQLIASGDWRPLDANQLEEHALPRELRRIPASFCDASALVGRDARAYNLTLPGGPSATLFIIPQPERVGLPASAPLAPQSSTQGLSIACWQRADIIYVVVIESDRTSDYQMLLRTSVPIAA